MHVFLDQVKDLHGSSCHATSKKANVSKGISCLDCTQGLSRLFGTVCFSIELSMPFTSLESHLVIHLSCFFLIPSLPPSCVPRLQLHWPASDSVSTCSPFLLKTPGLQLELSSTPPLHLPSALLFKLRPSHLSGYSLRLVYMLYLWVLSQHSVLISTEAWMPLFGDY